jgi:hypothetical protein
MISWYKPGPAHWHNNVFIMIYFNFAVRDMMDNVSFRSFPKDLVSTRQLVAKDVLVNTLQHRYRYRCSCIIHTAAEVLIATASDCIPYCEHSQQ